MDWLRRVKSVLYKWEVVEFKVIFSYVVSSKPRHETGCPKCLKQKLNRETTINSKKEVTQAWNPSIQEAEAEGWRTWYQPGPNTPLFQGTDLNIMCVHHCMFEAVSEEYCGSCSRAFV